MLVAKLKTPLVFTIQISPNKTETRECSHFIASPLGYVLGSKSANFYLTFGKIVETAENPASEIEGEGKKKLELTREKIFNETLNQEELYEWGSNDESLLEIFAKKYQLEIEEFVNI